MKPTFTQLVYVVTFIAGGEDERHVAGVYTDYSLAMKRKRQYATGQIEPFELDAED